MLVIRGACIRGGLYSGGGLIFGILRYVLKSHTYIVILHMSENCAAESV